jgi:hypothetical protein
MLRKGNRCLVPPRPRGEPVGGGQNLPHFQFAQKLSCNERPWGGYGGASAFTGDSERFLIGLPTVLAHQRHEDTLAIGTGEESIALLDNQG